MPDYYGVFVLATTLLMLTPGPNVAMIVANSVAYGARYGLMTLAGTTMAVMLHLVLVGIGLQGALGVVGAVFEYVRWAGVAYLFYLGIATWRAVPADLDDVRAQPRSARLMVARAFAVSLTNPKVLLFYGAFFPQFLSAARPAAPQIGVLCVTFLAVALIVDGGWVFAASRARRLLRAHGRLRNRISGGLLVGAGVGLALARRR